MAIRESRPIFNKPRQGRGGLGPWMLLALLAVLAAAGLYLYDKRHADRVAALQDRLATLQSKVDGEAAARKAMQGVASQQVKVTGGQVTGLWRAIKALQEKSEKLEADLQALAAKDAKIGASPDARAATLKDIAAIRTEMAALLRRLSALETRRPDSTPAAEPKPEPKPKSEP
jgi:chromosome segregation ATPase